MRIDVIFRDRNTRLPVDFREPFPRLDVGFKSVERMSVIEAGDVYDGAYTVEPSQEEQELQTANKVLRRNVVVKEIQMSLATIAQINRLF